MEQLDKSFGWPAKPVSERLSRSFFAKAFRYFISLSLIFLCRVEETNSNSNGNNKVAANFEWIHLGELVRPTRLSERDANSRLDYILMAIKMASHSSWLQTSQLTHFASPPLRRFAVKV